MTTADSTGRIVYPNYAASTDSSVYPVQLGLLWSKSGGDPLCFKCNFHVRGYCSVGRQMTPTGACYEYVRAPE